MDFIVCSADRMELRPFPDDGAMDFDLGGENDVEITCTRGQLQMGYWIMSPGTEYCAIIEEMEVNTNTEEETWRGNAIRKLLEQYIIQPPSGQDYRTVSGDANAILESVLGGAYGGLFTFPEASSEIDIPSYQFDRYTDALTGFSKMLATKNARLNIEVIQGGANEAFEIMLSAVSIQDLSEEIEYSQDSRVNISIEESRRGINHMICLGKGELKDRQVVHLYTQLDGSISQKQYYKGLQERTAVYDNNNAEDLNELIEGGTKKLQEDMNYKKMSLEVQDMDLQIGDIIGGRDYNSGLSLKKPVVQKIVKIESGTEEIEYKVEGEE